MKRQKLTGKQVDALLALAERKYKLMQQQFLALGGTQAELDEIDTMNHPTFAEGATLELQGAHYRLDHTSPDGKRATLRKVRPERSTAPDIIEYDENA